MPGGKPPPAKVALTQYDSTREGMRRMMSAIIYRGEAIRDDLIEMRLSRQRAPKVLPRQPLAQCHGVLAHHPLARPNIAARLVTKGRLDALTISGLYLYGTEDVLTPVEWGFEQEKALPNIQFFYPEECGHQGQTDRPDLFNLRFLEFFRDGQVAPDR